MQYRNSIALLVFGLLLSACGSSSGGGSGGGNTSQSFYIDASAGSDMNAGSQANPWQTLGRINTANTNIPTTVFLKRGEVWYEPLIVPTSNFSVDAYGTGALPVINGSATVTGWTGPVSGVYSATVTLVGDQALGNLSEDGVMMKFLPWDNDAPTTFTAAPTGSYSYSFPDTLYIKPAGDPSMSVYRASIQLRGIYTFNLSNIAIRNVTVTRTSLNAIEFRDCVNCSVESAVTSRIGGAVIGPNSIPSPDYLYAGNGIDFSNSCVNGSVNNVTVSEAFDSCLALELYQNNNNASSIQFSNSTLDRCGFAGVEISVLSNQGVNTNSTISGVSVSSVTVDQAGKGWSGRRYGTEGHGMRIIADTGAGSMNNIVVGMSHISNSAGDGVKLAGDIGSVTMHRIRATGNNEIGIDVADPLANTLRLDLSSSIIDVNGSFGLSYNAPSAAGLNVYHTTFYDNTVSNLAVFNQSGVANIRNNLFFSSAPMTHFYSAAALVNPVMDHNCYNDTTNMFGYVDMMGGSVAYSTVTAFNAATGFEANGLGNGIVGLTDPGNGMFQLTGVSDCRGLGDGTVPVTEDFSGAVFASPPSSGALQF